MITIEDLLQAENDLNDLQEHFLHQQGWEQSCQFPDSCWRWTKEVDGKTLAVSKSDAFDFEVRVCPDRRCPKCGSFEVYDENPQNVTACQDCGFESNDSHDWRPNLDEKER